MNRFELSKFLDGLQELFGMDSNDTELLLSGSTREFLTNHSFSKVHNVQMWERDGNVVIITQSKDVGGKVTLITNFADEVEEQKFRERLARHLTEEAAKVRR